MTDIYPYFTAEYLSRIFVICAAIVAGLWVLFKIIMERTYQPALEIDITVKQLNHGSCPNILLDVFLINKGKTRLDAASKKVDGVIYPGFAPDEEKLQYSCELQIKRFESPSDVKEAMYVNWFDCPYLRPLPSLGKINLLYEYVNPGAAEADFWMEPGETCHLLCPLSIPPGQYLFKVTFVGKKNKEDLWIHTIFSHIE